MNPKTARQAAAEALGRELRLLRQQQGLRQRDVARAVDTSVTWLSQVENGRRWPSKVLLERLQVALAAGRDLKVLAASIRADTEAGIGNALRGRIEERLSWTPPSPRRALEAASLGHGPHLGEDRPVTFGSVEETLEAAIALVMMAVREHQGDTRDVQSGSAGSAPTITLTLSSLSTIGTDSDFERRWGQVLQAAMWHGHVVQHLWHDTVRPPLEEWILNRVGFTGRYQLGMIDRSGVTGSTFDAVTVSGMGVVILLATEDARRFDSGCFLPLRGPLAGIGSLVERHIDALARRARWVLEAIGESDPSKRDTEYERVIEVTETTDSDLLLVKGTPSVVFEPPSWIQRRAEDVAHHAATEDDRDEIRHTVKTRLRRQRTFLDRLGHYRFRQILSIGSLRTFLQTGYGDAYDTLLRSGRGVPTVDNREAIVREVIKALTTHPQYVQIGVSDGEVDHIVQRTYWELIGRTLLVMSFEPSQEPGRYLRRFNFRSSEPSVVDTFYGLFEQLWESIPDDRREPRAVASVLERELHNWRRGLASEENG